MAIWSLMMILIIAGFVVDISILFLTRQVALSYADRAAMAGLAGRISDRRLHWDEERVGAANNAGVVACLALGANGITCSPGGARSDTAPPWSGDPDNKEAHVTYAQDETWVRVRVRIDSDAIFGSFIGISAYPVIITGLARISEDDTVRLRE